MSIVDWSLAAQVARGVAGLQPAGDPVPFEGVAVPAAEAERLVSAYTGLVPLDGSLPPAEPVSRDRWIEANLRSLGAVLDPVAGQLSSRVGGPVGGMLGAALGTVLALEAGAISGFLAGRVLGQYEFAVLDPGGPARLLYVTPNLGQAATALDAEPDQLLRWVALHETTHALQFGGVPWLREYLAGMVGELLGALDVDPRGLLRMPDMADMRTLMDAVREGQLATLMVGTERRALLDRVQTFMAVLEGYAEHVMDAVGADVLDDLDHLRKGMERRRRDRSGLLRVIERLIGLDMKLRQYELGKKFCDAVVARGGIAALNRVWASPDALPAPDELERPLEWLERTERAGLDRAA
jgi:coenzyme F420 biosynthesis associated uncharacterized protein